MTQPQKPIKTFADIPGWFPWIDQLAFDHFLSPDAVVPDGDLVELGVYMGTSAAYIGRYLKPSETFTVIDLFGTSAGDAANQQENTKSYATLNRAAFERNYLSLFDQLPVVIEGPSSEIVDHVAPASVRFLHVDASHLYDHVRVDVQSAVKLLRPNGVVVFDDFRSEHTPGTSAAVWEAVFSVGLKPLCLSPQKLYGTFGDHAPHSERLMGWLTNQDRLWFETTEIAGVTVARVGPKPAEKKAKQDPVQELDGRLTQRARRLEEQVSELRTTADRQRGRIEKLEKAQAAANRTFTRRARRKLGRMLSGQAG